MSNKGILRSAECINGEKYDISIKACNWPTRESAQAAVDATYLVVSRLSDEQKDLLFDEYQFKQRIKPKRSFNEHFYQDVCFVGWKAGTMLLWEQPEWHLIQKLQPEVGLIVKERLA